MEKLESPGQGGQGGGALTKFHKERLWPKIQSLTLLYIGGDPLIQTLR